MKMRRNELFSAQHDIMAIMEHSEILDSQFKKEINPTHFSKATYLLTEGGFVEFSLAAGRSLFHFQSHMEYKRNKLKHAHIEVLLKLLTKKSRLLGVVQECGITQMHVQSNTDFSNIFNF